MPLVTGVMLAGVNREEAPLSSGYVYRLTVWLYAAPVTYPHPVRRERVGFFGSRESAEAMMRKMTCINDHPNEEEMENQILDWEIEQVPLDVQGAESGWPLLEALSWHYDTDARYQGECSNQIVPFYGRRPAECRYQIGDFVQFRMGEVLQAGIISGLPITPERAAASRERYRQHPLHSLPNAAGEVKEIFLQPDQSDATYSVLYDWDDLTDYDAAEYSLSPLVAPLDSAYRERLEARLRWNQGFTPLIIHSNDSGLKGIQLAINTYALDRLKERYVLVYKYFTHIAVSLETFTVVDGDLTGFIAEDMGQCASLKEVLEFLMENADQFRRWFDQYGLGLMVEEEASG